jgi:NAD(P)-dependent dehydrogenase (short-subunit alcohol dehydrogenase family)
MDARLRGKVALITGASGGIGGGIARVLAAEGASLAMADLRPPPPELVSELREAGARPLVLDVDVSREPDVVRMVAETVGAFGRVDLFVSNAAAAWHQPFMEVTSEAWHATLNANLSACLWGCREMARHLIEQRSGSILIVGSVAALHPSYGQVSYSASKLALRSLCQTLAIELAPYGIRVNSLLPGHHETALTAGLSPAQAEAVRIEIPLQRFGSFEASGHAAAFLLSDALSPYTTGAELVVDGGLQLRPLRMPATS